MGYRSNSKNRPTAAVRAMAMRLQKQTRRAPRKGEAPPTFAAVAPQQDGGGGQSGPEYGDGGANGKGDGGPDCCLNRVGTEFIGNADFVAGMGSEGIVVHQLPGHFEGE